MMEDSGDWSAIGGVKVEEVEFNDDSECFHINSIKGYTADLSLLDIPPDPLGARVALYCRNEDGSWKRYFKEEN